MPLYVADALDAAEREALHHHLASGCVTCAGALAEFQATFAAVPLALDRVAPKPELLQRVMDRIDAKPVTAGPTSSSSFWRLVPLAAAAALLATVVTYTVVDRRDRAIIANAQLTYNGDARAALLQSALADRDATLSQLKRRLLDQQQLVDALQSKDARIVELAGAGQPKASARLVWSPSTGRSVLLAQNLTPPPPGRAYELWFITTEKKPVPSVTFTVDATGSSTQFAPIPAGLAPLAVAAITEEPAGGVPAPTGDVQLASKAQ